MGELGQVSIVAAHDQVGIQSRLEALEKLLDLSSKHRVRMVAIVGMGGIGKTTLASVLYDRISRRFDASCFLADVSKVSKVAGILRLQEKLLSEILKENLKISDDRRVTSLISTRLSHLRTLIVLDNVDHSVQLEKLAGETNWFGAGSRIIITSRDEHILRECGVDKVYKVEHLDKDEALRLFCRIAFKCDYPKRGYGELTNSVLEYAKGLPLAIKSWGSYLLNQNVSEWKSVLMKLQKIPKHVIVMVPGKCFDRLTYLEKEIFLDVACFYNEKSINYARKVLLCCGFNPETGIQSLIEKSLITISNDKIQMHCTFQEMGWEIIQQESPFEPGNRSRLWLYEDICHVMESNTATERVEAIILNLEEEDIFPLRVEALSKMSRLRLLIFHNVKFSGHLRYLSNELRYVSWHKYPFIGLPSSFEPRRLVELIMPNSNIAQLWEGIKTLPNLRSMDLHGSVDIVQIPDFRGIPNLERLNLEGCTQLRYLHPSIATLQKLRFLNMKNCTNLVSIPNGLFSLSSLEILNLAGCLNFAECLDFDPIMSSVEVKLLSSDYPPFFAEMSSRLVSFVKRREVLFCFHQKCE